MAVSKVNVKKDFLSKQFVDDFCTEMLEFFDREYTRELVQEGRDGKELIRLVPNALPTIQGFAKSKGISSDKLRAYAEKYPEINEAMVRCKDMAHDMLLNNALLGLYSSSPAMLALKNLCGFTDKGSGVDAPALLNGNNNTVNLNVSALLMKISEKNKEKGLLDK